MKNDEIKGSFVLNGVKVNYTYKPNYISEMGHFDFDSDRTPNALTETGYRSYFPSEKLTTKNITEHIKEFLKAEIKGDFALEIGDEKIGEGQISLTAY